MDEMKVEGSRRERWGTELLARDEEYRGVGDVSRNSGWGNVSMHK